MLRYHTSVRDLSCDGCTSRFPLVHEKMRLPYFLVRRKFTTNAHGKNFMWDSKGLREAWCHWYSFVIRGKGSSYPPYNTSDPVSVYRFAGCGRSAPLEGFDVASMYVGGGLPSVCGVTVAYSGGRVLRSLANQTPKVLCLPPASRCILGPQALQVR